jgi:hypothetical protein
MVCLLYSFLFSPIFPGGIICHIMCLTDTANVFMSNKSLFGRKHPASKRCAGACFYYYTMHIVYMEIYFVTTIPP